MTNAGCPSRPPHSSFRHSTFVICPMSIADNFHRVQERIARAAESAGRHSDEITLVGVTKYVGAQLAAELVAAGCHNLGESRPQELWKKADALFPERAGPSSAPPIHWHLIGHLQ